MTKGLTYKTLSRNILPSLTPIFRRFLMLVVLMLAWSMVAPHPAEIADSQHSQVDPVNFPIQELAPRPISNSPRDFEATAYCDDGITKSGVPVAPGIVAADPTILPLGSLIQVKVAGYSGLYRVMDTGLLVKGNIIDIYISSEEEAIEFGRRKAKVTLLRYGFPKRLVEPTLVE